MGLSGGAVDVAGVLAAAIARGEAVAVATVVRTDRSVPRRPGAKMLVYGDGRTVGTVGGGEMEARVRAAAAAALGDGEPRLLTYRLVDPGTGDPGVCGGEVDVYVEAFVTNDELLIVGAGHVGAAVAELAGWLGLRVAIWDDRPEVLGELADLAGAAVLGGSIADALAALPVSPRTSVVVVTRNMALDLELLPAILATDAAYVGVMGSKRRWTTTRERLAETGVPATALERVHSPIGLEIAAETPQEIAVSIVAEVVAHARSR